MPLLIVLIESKWNVNFCKSPNVARWYNVLIESKWNVNNATGYKQECREYVLIESKWNVNFSEFSKSVNVV